jgi:hypothetical protein
MEQEGKGTKAQGTEDEGDRLGPYRLGRGHELGPGLGCVYEAWNVDTGAVSLVLVPDEQVDWRPSGAWKVKVSYDPTTRALMMEVEEAPASADYTDLANILVMLSAAFERLEVDPQIQAHLAMASGEEAFRGAPRLPLMLQRPRFNRSVAFVGLALCAIALGLGLWFYFKGWQKGQEGVPSGVMTAEQTPTNAQQQVDSNAAAASAISDPMPKKPYNNQAVAPCYPELGEVEINGGCWVTLERRAPCLKTQAEYQGKCYLSVTKGRVPPLNSVRPEEGPPMDGRPLK